MAEISIKEALEQTRDLLGQTQFTVSAFGDSVAKVVAAYKNLCLICEALQHTRQTESNEQEVNSHDSGTEAD